MHACLEVRILCRLSLKTQLYGNPHHETVQVQLNPQIGCTSSVHLCVIRSAHAWYLKNFLDGVYDLTNILEEYM
jgi:hypothetical protein